MKYKVCKPGVFIKGALIFVAVFSSQRDYAQVGKWSMSSRELPVYQYTGALPFKAFDKDGKDAVQPEDPYFLLGNYRFTVFTHASGIYQLITAERAWARLNASPERPNYGWNEASIVIGNNRPGNTKAGNSSVGNSKTGNIKPNSRVVLTGVNSLANDRSIVEAKFGTGFASYTYKLSNNIECTRLISVKPSLEIHTGNPSFVVTLIIKNSGRLEQNINYSERMLVNYVLNSTQYSEKQKRPLAHEVTIRTDSKKEIAIAGISAKANQFMVLPGKEERFVYDVAPPSVFMLARNSEGITSSQLISYKDTLGAELKLSLLPGQTKSFNIVIGIADGAGFKEVQDQAASLLTDASYKNAIEGLFAGQWKKKLPDLSGEKDTILKREMLWNAHMMEASAKYSDYYKETFIPQGSVYSYFYGDNISNRDHLQAALAACYTNPALAKSAIRYVIKHSESDGEIKRGNYSGYGYTPPSLYKESDAQLYFFNTIAEYLRITRDYAFLNEKAGYYPAEDGRQDPVIVMLKKYFIYLRDEVGTGPNGLIKILNSDWSDSFFQEYSPNRYARSAESHLNSAMALAVLPRLIDVLKDSKNAEAHSFIFALESYLAALDKAFMKDLGDRKYAARAYLSSKIKFGTDVVSIEPQAYLLQIPTLSNARKKEMYEYIKSKLITPEKIGARTREKPFWAGNNGEDGGIWFSLEYALLLGVATFDKAEARSLLTMFSFNNFARQYPDYWVGQWTAADEVNSTLYREGLYSFWVGVPDLRQAFQGYCSHPHTWPLYCYFQLRE